VRSRVGAEVRGRRAAILAFGVAEVGFLVAVVASVLDGSLTAAAFSGVLLVVTLVLFRAILRGV